jgi:hypothetical protein
MMIARLTAPIRKQAGSTLAMMQPDQRTGIGDTQPTLLNP